MKKILIIFTLCAVCAAFAGCKKEDSSNVQTSETVTEYVMQEGDTVVSGEVVSVVGNEVTINVGTVSQDESAQPPSDREFPAEGETDGDMPQRGERQSFGEGEMPDFAGGERQNGGERPDFSGGDMQDGENSRGGKRSSVQIETTGESVSYIIPVGMPVSGSSGRQSDYTAISAGAAVQITLNSDGLVVACEIL
ncbi:MAG: hypothetical protein ACI4JF_04195 [Oscillospiraceae bacterium]